MKRWLQRIRNLCKHDEIVASLTAQVIQHKRRAAAAEQRCLDDREAFHSMMKAMSEMTATMDAYNLPRLSKIETDVEFAAALETRVRLESEWFHTHRRPMEGYESLTLRGVRIVPCQDRPGCVTFVPEGYE